MLDKKNIILTSWLFSEVALWSVPRRRHFYYAKPQNESTSMSSPRRENHC